jgi:hypothetical protein
MPTRPRRLLRLRNHDVVLTDRGRELLESRSRNTDTCRDHRQEIYADPRDNVGVAVVHAPAARIAALGRFRNDGAPARNHGAIMLSNIMQPNAELGMNGQMGLPHR